MRTRVSAIETFRRWREDEDSTPEDLVYRLSSNFHPSEPMLAGIAFHKALEDSTYGVFDTLTANGYTFHLPDAELALPEIRELRAYSVYGPLCVSGMVDVIHGKTVTDHKTTGYFRPDGYLEGYQWRFYLDIFGADVFRWNVFEIREMKPKVYEVAAPQILEAYRYPGLHEDCARMAADFYEVTHELLETA